MTHSPFANGRNRPRGVSASRDGPCALPDERAAHLNLTETVLRRRPITRDEALAAARSHLIAQGIKGVDSYWSEARASEVPPPGLYRTWDERAWYVWIPPEIDGGPWPALRSSTIIVVSKSTGRVIAQDSAHDEG